MKLASPRKGSGKTRPIAGIAKNAPREPEPPEHSAADPTEFAPEIDAADFRQRLMTWYEAEARDLPWRGITDPYRIWVSEIMLQQTRVAAVIDHYNEFLRRFPTLVSLALAPEPDVLAAWSGLGYYRRARMLHKAAQFIMLEREGRLPATSIELRTLPGIGEYTAAAIASIAFGESVAVVDGNVERVILRLTGRPNEATAAARAFVRAQAQAFVPPSPASSSHQPFQLPRNSAHPGTGPPAGGTPMSASPSPPAYIPPLPPAATTSGTQARTIPPENTTRP